MIITDVAFGTIVTGIKEGRGLYRKIQAIIYFFVLVSVMEAIIFFTDSFLHSPNWMMFDTWQLNLLYLTAHAFPSLGFVLMWTSKNIMNEKPRDSAQIIPRDIYKALFIQMILMGITIAMAYYFCYYGVISVSPYNLTPISDYNLHSDFDIPIVNPGDFEASLFKARTLAFAVLFIQEGLIMPMQIRRINEPLKKSWRDAWEFGWYLAVPIAFILISYIIPLEAALSNLFGGTLFFVFLDPSDWLLIALFCIPNLVGYELIRKKIKIIEYAKK
jgi:magnesium-transporting ATPase (P-type)